MKRTKPEIQASPKISTQEAEPLQSEEVPVVKPIEATKERSLPAGRQGESSMKFLSNKIIIAVYAALILLGVGTGYLLSRSGAAGITGGASSMVNTGKVVGSTDTKTFKDSAVGVIQKGGSGGEGTHALIRDGGPSQTAYLISSIVDLDVYVGKKVKVWGQTMAAKKVSWLMDVGKVELQ
jgi:hypothetical protein